MHEMLQSKLLDYLQFPYYTGRLLALNDANLQVGDGGDSLLLPQFSGSVFMSSTYK